MRFPLRLTGLVAAPHTPMDANGSINPNIVQAQFDLLRGNGVSGAFICGTTGESLSLTHEERKLLTAAWLKTVNVNVFPVIVHVGANSVKDACMLAEHAASCGASAIAVMAPNFFKPTLDDLIAYCAEIASWAPKTPLYYYDIPSMSGVFVPTARFLEQGVKSIPTLHGVKFTNNDLVTLLECLVLGEFDIVFGFDELLLSALALGVKGAVGSTYNFAVPIYQRLIAAFERGDLATARQAQLQSVRLIRTLQEFGFSRASKAMMGLMGVDCGPVRLPLKSMTDAEVRELARRLEGMDGLSRPIRFAL